MNVNTNQAVDVSLESIHLFGDGSRPTTIDSIFLIPQKFQLILYHKVHLTRSDTLLSDSWHYFPDYGVGVQY